MLHIVSDNHESASPHGGIVLEATVWPPKKRAASTKPAINQIHKEIQDGLVEAVTSHGLRDGTGTFQTESLPSVPRRGEITMVCGSGRAAETARSQCTR